MQKILIILFVTIASVAANAIWESKVVCTNGKLTPNAKIASLIGACKDPAVWGTEEGKKNLNCNGICIANAFGFMCLKSRLRFNGQLDGDDNFSKDAYLQWIEKDFGVQNKKLATDHILNCFEKYASKVDKNDKNCTQIKNFDTCIWELQPQMNC